MHRRTLGLVFTKARPFLLHPHVRVRFASTNEAPLHATVTEVKSNSDKIAVEALSGMPDSVLDRPVRITKATRHAMQSGDASADGWRLVFPETPYWEERVMGWTSSANPVSSLRLKFPSREAAARFCEENSFDYQVDDEPIVRAFKKNYGDKFKYRPPPKTRSDTLV